MQESSSRAVGGVGQTPARNSHNETIQYGCAAEPIHQLGTVQSHGLVMVIDINTLCVVQFSEGWVRHFTPQPRPENILGSKVDKWFDLDEDAFRGLLLDMAMEMRPTQLDVGFTDKVELEAQTYHSIKPVRNGEVLIHRIRQYAVIEWTPMGTASIADMAQLFQLSKLNEALAILRRTEDESAFFSASAMLLQKMSEFDRVMIYRFLPDYSGEVLAESVSTKTEIKYQGMRFPAGDIPAQARELYLRTLCHVLADVEARPDQLYPAVLPDGEMLNQTYCSLRQMSSAHLTYLHNMGVRASMSISLIQNGKLWGLVACHHMSPKVPPFHVRELMQASCELIANVISMRIEQMEGLANHKHKARLNQLINMFGQSLTESENTIAASVGAYSNPFLDFFDANHWLLRINKSRTLSLTGVNKEHSITMIQGVLDQIDRLLVNHPIGEPLIINCLRDSGAKFPADFDAAGLIALRFGIEGQDLCVFFRPEVSRELRWGGRPEKIQHEADDGSIYVEPRRSFNLWVEEVRGHCDEWSSIDAECLYILCDAISDLSQSWINAELNRKLKWRVRHDALTGLLNRSTLDAELNLLTHSPDASFALFMLDLDYFKQVNDNLGHGVGDQVIKEVAKRIASIVRAGDFAARFGGDEFVMVVHCEKGQTRAASSVARRLLQIMRAPIVLNNTCLVMTMSIGVAQFSGLGLSSMELMHRADMALYEAKRLGRSQFAIYTDEMGVARDETVSIESELWDAVLNNRGLRLFYQPKVDLRSGEVNGVEALIRWQHPTKGFMGPNEFIPIAERSELINDLGNWVIREAVAQCGRWVNGGLHQLTVAINVSFAQFARPEFLNVLEKSIEEHKVAPSSLEVELTESVVMKDASMALGVLNKLKEMGVRVTLDDFGTGYSSLSYLHQLPLTTLKIDRSFISNLEHDQQSRVVTQSVIDLARGLNIHTVAEGIEDDFQLGWLASQKCDYGQGYYYSRPVPAEEIACLCMSRMVKNNTNQLESIYLN